MGGLILTIVLFLGSYIYLRCFIYGIKRYQLNNSAYKKRKEEENFKEWLFYSRYKEEIPPVFRLLNYIVLIIHAAGSIACLLASIIPVPKDIDLSALIGCFICGFDSLWIFVIALLFWTPGRDTPYERWIVKKRGQKKKKKK